MICLKSNVPKRRLLGVGMGVPAPLEFSTDALFLPVMLSWDGYSVKEYLKKRLAYAPMWIMMLTSWPRSFGRCRDDLNFLFIKLGTVSVVGLSPNGLYGVQTMPAISGT